MTALSDFDDLLAAVGLSGFLDMHWGKEPLHIARRDDEFYATLPTFRTFDAVLACSPAGEANLRVENKETGPDYEVLATTYRELAENHRGPQLTALHAAYIAGQSVITHARRASVAIDRLCRSAEITLGRRASAELYLTPPNAQAFEIHFDVHDVFILQLDGGKRWTIYEPVVENPVAVSQESRLCGDAVGPPTREIDLQKGDLLYLPRGVPHQGVTEDRASLHLTIGIAALCLHDYLIALVEVAAGQDAALRTSLSPTPSTNQSALPSSETINRSLERLADVDLQRKALARLEDGFLDSLRPIPDGQFAEVDQLDDVAEDTIVERYPGQLCLVRHTDDAATLRFVGGSINGPAWLLPQFEWIAKTDRFRVGEIPGEFNLESRLVLVRRLIREGYLRRVDTSDRN